MRRLKLPAARYLLIAALALALGCGLIVTFGPALPLSSPIAAAKERWAASPVSHYRMVVEAGNPCRLEVEVRDEHVAAVLREDPCGHPVRTVSDLFKMIERAPSPLYTCAPPSCACRNVITIYALYDQRLGYPHRVAVLVERETNWRSMRFWRYVWSDQRLPDCAWSSSADIVNVRSLVLLH
jgi:uncharacterized protein DUF6174